MRKIGIILALCLLAPLTLQATKGPMEQLGQVIDQTAATMTLIAKLANDPLIEPLTITVKVNNGTAYLSGEVDTSLQYDRAMMISRTIPTIEKVDVENLKIKSSQHPLDDAWLTTKIKAKLFKAEYFNHQDIHVWPITVSTKNGKVYVMGEVDSQDQKAKILNIINSIPGIVNFRYDLRIKKTA
ncbi:MAG: BON domain-containing protein [Candidatus Berkiellales bacterium]